VKRQIIVVTTATTYIYTTERKKYNNLKLKNMALASYNNNETKNCQAAI